MTNHLEVADLMAENARLRSALKPFADSPYATIAGDWDDHEICKGIKVSDLRKAHAVLSNSPADRKTEA